MNAQRVSVRSLSSRLGAGALVLLGIVASASLARAQQPAPPPNAPAATLTSPAVSAPEGATPAPSAPSATPSLDPAQQGAAPAASAPSSANTDATSDAKAAAEASALAADLAAASAVSESSSDQSRLSIYGFADFNYTRLTNDFKLINPYDSFNVGNLNVYIGADLGDNWRSLIEVRFMYLPSGASPPPASDQPAGRMNTTVGDYSDLSRPIQWGGISIQRAWVERSFHKLLTVRVGHWLTPYGIWNVDHGSPVIIGVRRPYIIGESLFPQSQTGIEAYGTFDLDGTQFGYELTLSNGRGPLSNYQDLDNNKAIGGRLSVRNDSLLGTMTFGVSGYRGMYTNRHDVIGADANGTTTASRPIDDQYNELGLAADAKWELGGLLVQSEAIVSDSAYTRAGRPVISAFIAGPPGFAADNRRWGVYGLTGYRTPWWGIMPFFGGEHYKEGPTGLGAESHALWGGLNIRATPRVVLKGMFTHAWFPGDAIDFLDFQVAWSF
jgi:hypothetical protein